MSLLLNMLSRLVIAFLARSKHLLISWLQSPCVVILEPAPLSILEKVSGGEKFHSQWILVLKEAGDERSSLHDYKGVCVCVCVCVCMHAQARTLHRSVMSNS